MSKKINFNTDTVENYDYENSFELELSADKAFITSVLTNLYSRPTSAAIRETFANACDASEGDSPIEISTEKIGSLETKVTIKDHGCGMSLDQLKNNYLSYGSSTKTENLEVIGAFGFGAKAPLAVSGEFTVKTCDGKELSSARVYVADNGIFADVDSTPYEGESFTEVSFNVSKDVTTVQKMISNICLFGGKNVKVDGFSFDFKKVYEWGDLTIYSKNDRFSMLEFLCSGKINSLGTSGTVSIMVEVGGVTYPLYTNSHTKECIVCHKGIEEISFSPSREEIPGAGSILDSICSEVWSDRFIHDSLEREVNGDVDRVTEMVQYCISSHNVATTRKCFIVDGELRTAREVARMFASGDLWNEKLECYKDVSFDEIKPYLGRYACKKETTARAKNLFSPSGTKEVTIEELKKKSENSGMVEFIGSDRELKVLRASDIDSSSYPWYTCERELFDVCYDKPLFYVNDDSELVTDAKKAEDDFSGFKTFCYLNGYSYGANAGRTLESDGSYSYFRMLTSYTEGFQYAINALGREPEGELSENYSCFTYENVNEVYNKKISKNQWWKNLYDNAIPIEPFFKGDDIREISAVVVAKNIGTDIDRDSLKSDGAKFAYDCLSLGEKKVDYYYYTLGKSIGCENVGFILQKKMEETDTIADEDLADEFLEYVVNDIIR